MAHNNKKSELIEVTYELLKVYSPEDITIRMIGSAAGCTSTTIYRHFENLDHLITVASVRLLESYIIEVGGILNAESSPLDALRAMWQSFSVQAFKNVETFEMLFFGRLQKYLNDAIVEYYQMFPSKWWSINGIFTTVFFSNSVEERNLIIVRRAAADGYLSVKDAALLSDLQVSMFHGELLKYRKTYRNPEVAAQGAREFMEMYDYLIDAVRLK